VALCAARFAGHRGGHAILSTTVGTGHNARVIGHADDPITKPTPIRRIFRLARSGRRGGSLDIEKLLATAFFVVGFAAAPEAE